MKLEKITHDHLLTKWLKVIIFAILMLAPILSVATRCLYVICNKNAYQSYSNKTMLLNTAQITATNQILENETLYYQYQDETPNNQFIKWVGFKQLSFNPTDYGFTEGVYNKIQTYNDRIYLYNVGGTYEAKQIWGTQLTDFYIVADGNYSTSSDTLSNSTTKIYLQTYVNNGLDNVFDYSVAQLKQDQLFNWTQNTGVYTGINAMNTGLGLTDGTIAILITYWTLLTIIYVIIDILLEGFVLLTHMISKKAS